MPHVFILVTQRHVIDIRFLSLLLGMFRSGGTAEARHTYISTIQYVSWKPNQYLRYHGRPPWQVWRYSHVS
ncbi:hypothetical protein F4774DRAFT_373411 [Daldinia eschscholtzii]|nr:hypothetical protein F4774DRAFT_373411 [Daldinia eschscholtzii]